jgi:hypothetical protein
VGKPTSLVFRVSDLEKAIEEALDGRQMQPILVERWKR